jgi:hypothetical protein
MHTPTRRLLLVCLVFGVACTFVGCSSPAPQSASAATEQQMLDLKKQYDSGTISKEQYERESAYLRSKRDRELIQSGSPMNETVRGVLAP